MQGSRLFYRVPISSPGSREGQRLAESYTARNSGQLTKGSPSRIRSPGGKTPNLEPMSNQRSQAKTKVGTEEKRDQGFWRLLWQPSQLGDRQSPNTSYQEP